MNSHTHTQTAVDYSRTLKCLLTLPCLNMNRLSVAVLSTLFTEKWNHQSRSGLHA